MDKIVIQLENLVKTYHVGETDVHALRGVTYAIREGDFLAIMGPSGSGKSTMMNIIGCLDRPTSGKYLLEGEDVSAMDKNQLARVRNRRIGFVFQSYQPAVADDGAGECRTAPGVLQRPGQGTAEAGHRRS